MEGPQHEHSPQTPADSQHGILVHACGKCRAVEIVARDKDGTRLIAVPAGCAMAVAAMIAQAAVSLGEPMPPGVLHRLGPPCLN